MRLISTLFIMMVFAVNVSQAQSFKDKSYYQWGYQFGYYVQPSFDRLNTETNLKEADQYLYIQYSLAFRYRYNLKNIGDNQSLGIGVNPALGMNSGGSETGAIGEVNLALNIPLEVSYNIGAGSTYDTDKNRGVTIVAGLDYTLTPLVAGNNSTYETSVKGYALPFLGLGYSYWGKDGSRLRQWYARYNFANNKHDSSIGDEDIRNPIGITLGWVRYLNY